MTFFIMLMIFVLQNVWITNAAEPPMLGNAPCMYSGSFDEYGYYCPPEPMPLDWIPKECTSYVYDGLNCTGDGIFTFPTLFDLDEANIYALGSSGKPLYLYYGYESPKAWIEALNSVDPTVEAENLKNFLSDYTITGLILKNLNYDIDNCDSDYHFDECFYDKLNAYVSKIKEIIPDLSVGLYVSARNMIYYNENPSSPDWFNFVALNCVMQFYIIGFDKFNSCNECFKEGIVPLCDSPGSKYSLTSFEKALSCSTIEREKVYLEFLANPSTNDTTTEYLPTCCVTYKKFCEADNYNLFWCADTSDTFYQKGQFAKQINAQGIVTKYIDTIDPTAKCECESNKFITFSMMLRGFMGSDPITDCTKLNGVSAT